MPKKEWTLADFRSAHQPARAVARVCFRMDLWAEHARLDSELHTALAGDASENRDPQAPLIAERVKEIEDQIAASEQEFVFEAIGQQAWVALLAEHPPTAEHKEQGLDHDPATFPAAAVAASAVEPTISHDVALTMFADLNLAQWQRLWAACLAANLGGGEAPKSGLATAVRKLPARSSTTAAPEGSLEASS